MMDSLVMRPHGWRPLSEPLVPLALTVLTEQQGRQDLTVSPALMGLTALTV